MEAVEARRLPKVNVRGPPRLATSHEFDEGNLKESDAAWASIARRVNVK